MRGKKGAPLMPVKTFSLGDRFVDGNLERDVLAAVAANPQLRWELDETLVKGVCAVEGETWAKLWVHLEEEKPHDGIVPDGWRQSSSPVEDAEKLADYHQRRLIAGIQERTAAKLYDPSVPASEIGLDLEEEAAKAQRSIAALDAGEAKMASALVVDVLAKARENRQHFLDTGYPKMGILTGIKSFDELTGGLKQGVYLVAAGPSVGKTTTVAQISAKVAGDGVPVVYSTFENSSSNLLLKMVCARAGADTRQVERGTTDDAPLQRAAAEMDVAFERMALLDGTAALTTSHMRANALRLMRRFETDKCLIVVDYLQLFAKASAEMRSLTSVRERVEAIAAQLQELSKSLDNPVVAIASLKRDALGYGGDGTKSPGLDALKESGDLEYSADVVTFLTRDTKRTEEAGYDESTTAVNWFVEKSRNDRRGKVEMVFHGAKGQVREKDWKNS